MNQTRQKMKITDNLAKLINNFVLITIMFLDSNENFSLTFLEMSTTTR